MKTPLHLLLPVFLLFAMASASGQEVAGAAASAPPATQGFGFGNNEFAARTEGSFFSGHTWGRTQDRTLGMLDFRYTRRFFSSKYVELKYAVTAIPVAFFGDKAIFAPTPAQQQQRQYVYAFGGSPVGFQFTFRRGKRVQPFIVTDEGALHFSRPILVTNGERFNFIIDYGVGVQIYTSAQRAFTVGYRYFHISNADLAGNPGNDQNLFFLGYSFFR